MTNNLPLFNDFRLATLLAAERRGLKRRLLRRLDKTTRAIRQIRAALTPELAEWVVQLLLEDSRRTFVRLAPGEVSHRLYAHLRTVMMR